MEALVYWHIMRPTLVASLNGHLNMSHYCYSGRKTCEILSSASISALTERRNSVFFTYNNKALTVRLRRRNGRNWDYFSHKYPGRNLIVSTPIPIRRGALQKTLPRVLFNHISANITAAESGPLVRPEAPSVVTQCRIRSCKVSHVRRNSCQSKR